jgi:GTP-binding protein
MTTHGHLKDRLYTRVKFIMIIKSAEFVKSAVKPSQYPFEDLPEIAFTGRSNVGKSSLINTLVNRKHLVKTSSTPGRTQLINFFIINKIISLVDLPGFGYAKVPKSVRKSWGPMIETYLSARKTLKGTVLIMDIRRIPGMQELNFIEWLHYFNIPGILILTKSDKLSKIKQKNQHLAIAKALGVNKQELILFSAKSRMGKDEVWDAIKRLIGY